MEAELYKMTYKFEKNKVLRILGEEFVKNNRNKGKLIINNRKFFLEGELLINKIKKNNIKMKLNKNIFNKSYMFKNCESLQSLVTITYDNYQCSFDNMQNDTWDELDLEINDNKDENNILHNSNDDCLNENNLYNNIKSQISTIEVEEEEIPEQNVIFYFYNELKYFGRNYTILKEMFYNCVSLTFLPDISSLITNNVLDISFLFYNCKSLSSLPDISKWNTENIRDMSYMFYNCESLLSLPDISKWNTENNRNMSYMFYNCKNISLLPNISNWNTNNVINMSWMFYN